MSSLIDDEKDKGVSSDQYDLSPKDSNIASADFSNPAKVHEDEIKVEPPTEKKYELKQGIQNL